MFIAGEARLSAELSRIQSNFFAAPGVGITGPHLRQNIPDQSTALIGE
jgi:hypothetical protein